MKIFLKQITAGFTAFSIIILSLGQVAFAAPSESLKFDKNREGKTYSTCSTCSTNPSSTNPLDRLATLGRQTQKIQLLPLQRSLFKGFPVELVSSATGELSFGVTDLAFKDNPLMLFQRTYVSSRSENFGLGKGWSYAFNDSITLNQTNAILINSAGDKFVYQREGNRQRYVLQTPEAIQQQEFEVTNVNTITAKSADTTKIYKRIGGAFYLSQINASAGLEVAIKRNASGRMTNISSVAGEISLVWSNGANAKLLAVTDNTGRKVSFTQSNNLLQSVTTATNGQWQYEYADGRLTRAVDPANRVALRAKYDANERAVEFGDAVNLNRLTYQPNASNISLRTTVVDSLDYARVIQHNERGITTNVSDKQGVLADLQYNQANRLVQLTDATGGTATFSYDREQRLTRQTMPDGNERRFEYDAGGKLIATIENGQRNDIMYDNNGNLAESRGQRDDKVLRTTFNARGQRIRAQVENGLTVNHEYDSKGRETAYSYSDIGRFEKSYDAAGRKTSEKMPSGYTYRYQYNADNQITTGSDNRGRAAQLEYDANGALTRIVTENGKWSSITRDAAGRIVKLSNSKGQARHYAYNSRGALVEFTGADNRHFLFQYNERGELQNVVNARNNGLIYQRNQDGNLVNRQATTLNQKKLWQLEKTSYTTAPNPRANAQLNCLFLDDYESLYVGGSFDFSGFYTDMNSQTYGRVICYDPLGGVIDNFGGGGGEVSCEQCRREAQEDCDNQWYQCAGPYIAAIGPAGAACLALAAPPAQLGCALLSGAGIGIALGLACQRPYNTCVDRISSKCPQCRL